MHVGDANDTRARSTQAIDALRSATTDRPTLIIVDSHHRLRRAAQAGHRRRRTASRSARTRSSSPSGSTAGPRTRSSSCPTACYEHFADGIGARGKKLRAAWMALFDALRRRSIRSSPTSCDADAAARAARRAGTRTFPIFPADPKGIATRDSSGKVLNAIAPRLPWLIGGAADLAPSTKTTADVRGRRRLRGRQLRRPQPPLRHPRARDGRRSATAWRCRSCGPYGSAFLIFTDYMQPPIRLCRDHGTAGRSTSSRTIRSASARTARRTSRSSSWRRCAAIPGLITLRPADANEVAEAWRVRHAAASTSRPASS